MTAEKKKTGRPPTGSVRWDPKAWDEDRGEPGAWTVRCTGADGKRMPPVVIRGIAKDDIAGARLKAREVSDEMRAGNYVRGGTGETVAEWFGRYYKAAALGTVGKKNKGRPQAAVKGRRDRFKTWIEPHYASLTMVGAKPADHRRFLQKLDEQVRIRTAFYIEQGDDLPAARKGRKPGLAKKVGFPRGAVVRPLWPAPAFRQSSAVPGLAPRIGVGLPMLLGVKNDDDLCRRALRAP